MAGQLDWISGKRSWVAVRIYTDAGDEQYQWVPITDWSLANHADFVKRNVGRLDAVQGFQDGVSGFKSTKVTWKGPWNEAQCPLVSGLVYDVLLGIDDQPLAYLATVHLTDITPSNNVEDGPMLDFAGDSIGVFDYVTLGDNLLPVL